VWDLPATSKADFIDLDDALNRLAALDERQAQVVELRFFGGLRNNEIAEVLSTSEATVVRDWRVARAWLYDELAGK
jgi:RNA polymerase sigma factor (sigma-70 family)